MTEERRPSSDALLSDCHMQYALGASFDSIAPSRLKPAGSFPDLAFSMIFETTGTTWSIFELSHSCCTTNVFASMALRRASLRIGILPAGEFYRRAPAWFAIHLAKVLGVRDVFDVSLKLEHSLPFCGLSKLFPSVSIQRWCNLQVDILEIQSPREEDAEKIEPTLRKMLNGLGARLIRFNRYSSKNLEAVIGCKCAVDNSTVALIEWAGCIPVTPVNYHGGIEHCRLLAFTKDTLDRAMKGLSKVSKFQIESKAVVSRESARGAITVPVDEFLSALTKKQLAAFISAMQMGYYGMPKGATIDEIASKQGMKRSTYEEHLRKAELKILQAVRPYAGLAYVTSKGD